MSVRIVRYSLLFLLSAAFLFPLYWALITAFKSPAEANATPPTLFPAEFHPENFATAWTAQPFTRYLVNSVIVTTLAVIGMTLSSALVAYGFARSGGKTSCSCCCCRP